MQPRIADSYVPSYFAEVVGVDHTGGIASAVWPTANRASYMPVTFPYPCTIYSLSIVASNGTGNYDLGFYDGYSKNKIQTAGTTAMSAAGVKTLTFTRDIRVDAGKLYYAACVLSSTSGTVWRFAPSSSDASRLIVTGAANEALALPLPATMTPVTLTMAVVPVFVFGVR